MTLIAAVFDLDGTLIDSHRDIANALNEVLESLGVAPHPVEDVKTMIGGGVRSLLTNALAHRDPSLVDRAHERFRSVYERRLVETTRLYNGMPEVLAALRGAGIATLVATNKPSYFTERVVRALGIDVDAIASADEVAAKKPDPAVIRLALTRANLSDAVPSGVAYVGDMPVDRAAAANFGGPFFGVTWGFDPTGLREGTPRLATSPADLRALLLGYEPQGEGASN